MSCPYCGGWHGSMHGSPPPIPTLTDPNPMSHERLRNQLAAILDAGRADPYERDVLPLADGKLWQPRVYGTDETGREVTASFGVAGSTRENHTMIAKGHTSDMTFYGPKRHKGHDHADGVGGYADRNNYSDD